MSYEITLTRRLQGIHYKVQDNFLEQIIIGLKFLNCFIFDSQKTKAKQTSLAHYLSLKKTISNEFCEAKASRNIN